VRALITGGQGFVGHHLRRHLEGNGDEVIVLDLETDVTDVDIVGSAIETATPDAIYHLAALSHVGDSWNDPTRVLSVNVLGTANVLAGARRCARPPKTLVVSSAEVYGIVTPEDLPLTEASPVAPASPYAASKAAAEQVALQASRGFDQDVVVVRPFNHVGPGQAPVFAVPALAKRIVDAKASGSTRLNVGNLSTRRDFTDVRDVVVAYRLLIEHGQSGEIYNVASGHDVSIDEIVDDLMTIAACPLEKVVDPSLVRPVDVPVLRGSYEKLEHATGWRPSIDLATTLTDVVNDFATQQSLQ
jgi:GDP-4-dehydro-6-deoxy-D-mannose reductase